MPVRSAGGTLTMNGRAGLFQRRQYFMPCCYCGRTPWQARCYCARRYHCATRRRYLAGEPVLIISGSTTRSFRRAIRLSLLRVNAGATVRTRALPTGPPAVADGSGQMSRLVESKLREACRAVVPSLIITRPRIRRFTPSTFARSFSKEHSGQSKDRRRVKQ
jgi:hypothetical protein